jgi:hypothetical protein
LVTSSEEDRKFKNRLQENIEKAGKIKENVIYFPCLLDSNKDFDSEEEPEMSGG